MEDELIAGHSYVAGRDKKHAEHAAVLDALLQTNISRDRVLETVITPLDDMERVGKAARASKVAATKVEFFTMVRGDD